MTLIVDNLTIEGLLQSTVERRIPTTTALANTTTSLTVSSNSLQIFTGSTSGQILKLPNAQTLLIGHYLEIQNAGSSPVSIRLNDGTTVVQTLAQSSSAYLRLVDNSTTNGTWTSWQIVAQTAAGLIYQDASASTTTTTTSASYALLDSMTLTMNTSGYYLCLFNGSTVNSNNGQSGIFSFFVNSTQDTNSERTVTTGGGTVQICTLQRVLSVNSGDVLTVQWKRSANTQTCTNRTVTAVKVG